MVKFLQNKLTNQEISININMCLWQTNAFETGVNKILSWLSQIQNKKNSVQSVTRAGLWTSGAASISLSKELSFIKGLVCLLDSTSLGKKW